MFVINTCILKDVKCKQTDQQQQQQPDTSHIINNKPDHQSDNENTSLLVNYKNNAKHFRSSTWKLNENKIERQTGQQQLCEHTLRSRASVLLLLSECLLKWSHNKRFAALRYLKIKMAFFVCVFDHQTVVCLPFLQNILLCFGCKTTLTESSRGRWVVCPHPVTC